MRKFCLNTLTHRHLPALALAAAFGLGVVHAGDTLEDSTIKTVLKLKNDAGDVELLHFDGALAIGEARGDETDAGTPVLVTRTPEGLRIELAERTINIALPDAEADADGRHGHVIDVQKLVRIEDNGSGDDGETRVVVLRGDHAALDEGEIERMLDGDGDALNKLHADDGHEVRKVHIVRKQVEDSDATN